MSSKACKEYFYGLTKFANLECLFWISGKKRLFFWSRASWAGLSKNVLVDKARSWIFWGLSQIQLEDYMNTISQRQENAWENEEYQKSA